MTPKPVKGGGLALASPVARMLFLSVAIRAAFGNRVPCQLMALYRHGWTPIAPGTSGWEVVMTSHHSHLLPFRSFLSHLASRRQPRRPLLVPGVLSSVAWPRGAAEWDFDAARLLARTLTAAYLVALPTPTGGTELEMTTLHQLIMGVSSGPSCTDHTRTWRCGASPCRLASCIAEEDLAVMRTLGQGFPTRGMPRSFSVATREGWDVDPIAVPRGRRGQKRSSPRLVLYPSSSSFKESSSTP